MSLACSKTKRDLNSNIIQIVLKEKVAQQRTLSITTMFKVLAEVESKKTIDACMTALLW